MFKMLAGASLDLSRAKVRKLSAEEAQAGPARMPRRMGPGPGGGGAGPGGGPQGGGPGAEDDFPAVMAAKIGGFPDAEKNIKEGTAQVVEVTVPIKTANAKEDSANAKLTIRMVFDPIAKVWQPVMITNALKDPSIVRDFMPKSE